MNSPHQGRGATAMSKPHEEECNSKDALCERGRESGGSMSAKKPWEEEWRTCPLDSREVECPVEDSEDDDAYPIAEEYMGSDHGHGYIARPDRARFIAAAPDMARALLGVLGPDLHLVDCDSRTGGACSEDCANTREALKKAGVIA